MKIMKLREHPECIERAARWFADKWDVPLEAYAESIRACISQPSGVPQWYLVTDGDRIAGGAGVIENDFHDRPDLTPNLCALFVEEDCRSRGIARELLTFVRQDMADLGIETLYLVTDHTAFYEKCGWEFHTVVRDDSGCVERMYTAQTSAAQRNRT